MIAFKLSIKVHYWRSAPTSLMGGDFLVEGCAQRATVWSDTPSEVTCVVCCRAMTADERGRRRPMTTAEAGRKGGLANVARHGREHFVALGRKGGSIGGPKVRRLIAAALAAEAQAVKR